MLRYFYILLFASPMLGNAQTKIHGKIFSGADSAVLYGANIKLLPSGIEVKSNKDGSFEMEVSTASISLSISHIGFKTSSINLITPFASTFNVYLAEDLASLEQVTVVSTGYQRLTKERATGSFVKVDQALLNRRVSTDIIARLDDIVPGMLYNRTGSRKINIRGQSTLFGNSEPLVVIDNFPYDGDISNLNPNDVESVTVLKDAAAASIWGAKAANGVIVITTKQGIKDRASEISFNSNVSIGERPDLSYQPIMSTSDFIEIERQLFASNFYTSTENSANRAPLTPIIELLIAKRDQQIGPEEAEKRIAALKAFDVRKDYEKYLYRNQVNQQYALSLRGGGANNRYYISAGYDKNMESLLRNQYSRVTLNANNSYSFLKEKFELNAAVYYAESIRNNNNQGTSVIGITPGAALALYPYAQLADENGNPLPTVRGYRSAVVASAQSLGLLDWSFSPLEEVLSANNESKLVNYRLNASLKYKILPQLDAQVLYQYGRSAELFSNLQSQQTWYTRNEINRLSLIKPEGIERPIPLGGILDTRNSFSASQSLRGQLNYNHTLSNQHDITAIAGYERRILNTSVANNRLYGYNEELGTSVPVNFISVFPLYINPLSTSSIASNMATTELSDRYLSYYSNVAYTYGKRYTAYLSARLDQSNLFGVNTNQKGVPLWSAGIAWTASREKFYQLQWLELLKVRVSFGYNGSVDKRISAYTTARYFDGSSGLTKLPYANIINPPNPELRWERVKTTNLGLDFSAFGNRLSGSLEYYTKIGIDLIGDTPYPQSSGISTFTGNYANTGGTGFEFQLNAKNIDGQFKWLTNFLFANVKDKVTHYLSRGTGANYITSPSAYPIVGRPQYSIYSYPYAGLDQATGNPQGYLNGALSQSYSQIIGASTLDNIVFHGSARPTVFGAVRNTFTLKNFSLSANISYRMGYYFRRQSVNYYQVLSGNGSHSDYGLRWQKPGDELHTSVPSLPAARNTARDNLYLFSTQLVERGDHIRLQDLTFNYTLQRTKRKSLPFKQAEIYVYVDNIGLLWKETKYNIDPDYAREDFVPIKTIALGVKLGF